MRFQARRTISTNFALREVRTAAYDERQAHLRLIALGSDHGVWPLDFNNKNREKNLAM